MKLCELSHQAKDLVDVLKHVKSVKEAARGVLPSSMVDRRVLNVGAVEAGRGEAGGSDATDVAQELRKLRNTLKVEAIDDEGRVDYRKLSGSETFAQLERTSRRLRDIRPETIESDAQRTAFWINIYNVLSIHGVIAMDIDSSVMEMPAFFNLIAYEIGGNTVTPDEIENGVLRRNAGHPVSGKPLFRADDPRCAYGPSSVDPRIHAALVCASTSCPPVSFYEPEDLDKQLDAATRNYVASEVEVDGATLRYPITFRYYASDFGGEAGVPDFVRRHAEGEHLAAIEARYADPKTKIEYARYDWSLNAAL